MSKKYKRKENQRQSTVGREAWSLSSENRPQNAMIIGPARRRPLSTQPRLGPTCSSRQISLEQISTFDTFASIYRQSTFSCLSIRSESKTSPHFPTLTLPGGTFPCLPLAGPTWKGYAHGHGEKMVRKWKWRGQLTFWPNDHPKGYEKKYEYEKENWRRSG